MENFTLHLPTKIIFGRETIKQIGPETSAFGKKVLLVYGRGSIKKNGVYQQVMDSLVKAGLSVTEYPGVRSNPILNHIRAGVALARKARVEAVVAVGGGSVIDSAKAIAAGAMADHDVWDFFTGNREITAKLPLTCVLTLAAAGSEMNGNMVITNEQLAQKFGIGSAFLKPEASILDPTATFSVPANYTAYGAVDAIAHILEYYFTTAAPHTPVQDRLMEGLVLNIIESCEQCLADPNNYDGRSALMWCSTLALNGLTAAGLGPVTFPMHMIEHSLSALYDVPHGAGLSVVMPAWMGWRSENAPARFARFGRRIFNLEGGEREVAEAGTNALRKWFAEVGSPISLADLDIAATDIPTIAQNSLQLAKLWGLVEYEPATIETILRRAADPCQTRL